MSTYTGAATLVDVINVSASRGGIGTGTAVGYTVPAGHFAEIQVMAAATSANWPGLFEARAGSVVYSSALDPNSDSYSFFDTENHGSGDTTRTIGTYQLMNEGQTVQVTVQASGSASISGILKLYKKP